jgi:hypothetical protein
MDTERLSRLVVALLSDGELAAPVLRCRLAEAGAPLPRLAFDGLMAGLEYRRLVRGRYAHSTELGSSCDRRYGLGLNDRGVAGLRAA